MSDEKKPKHLLETEEQEEECNCDLLYHVCGHMLTTDTASCAAAMLIIYQLKNKSGQLSEGARDVLALAEEDFLAGQDLEWDKRNIRLWDILEYLVNGVGCEFFTTATLEIISIVAEDDRFAVKTREGLELTEEMEMIIHFARICVR